MKRLVFATFSTALLVAFTSAAQTPIQDRPAEVVSASPIPMFSQRSLLWPSQKIEGAENEAKPLSETLNSTPGIQARENGSPLISIRGSSSADRVLRLYEGIPLSDGLFVSDVFLPKESIGNVRVFKGPASAFYGSSAMAGALDFETRAFSSRAFRASTASYDDWLGERSLFAATPFESDRHRGQVTAFYERRPGRYPFTSTTTETSDVRDNNASDTSRVTATSRSRFGRIEVRPVFLLARHVGELPKSLHVPVLSTFDYAGSVVGVEASVSSEVVRKTSLRISDVRQWGIFDRRTNIESNSFTSRTLASFDMQVPFGERLLSHTFADQQWSRLAASYLGDANLQQEEFDFGQGFEIGLGPTLSFEPVVRYRANSGDLFKAAGLIRSDGRGRQWLTYGEGFRAASLSDRYSDTSYFKGNRGLRPERSRAVELGFEHAPENVTYGATVYAIRYDDLYDTAAAGGAATTKVNSGRAFASGLEIASSFESGQEVFKAAYAYLDAKNEDTGEPLRLSPRHQSTLSAAHLLSRAVAELKHTLWSSFHDRHPQTNKLQELPSWTSWDLEIRSRNLEDWELRAGVANLFDTHRELTMGYPEAQRRFYVSALRFY